ncbi:hypothetical protein AcW1_006522 [Taiwanofungus camphoratus]|nr:hypothetical protein AcV5_009109 [Antrodia cinnamomea]KAI0954725.1 hypothetical protein AcW1_006522 [Antrodia cinnamomea]
MNVGVSPVPSLYYSHHPSPHLIIHSHQVIVLCIIRLALSFLRFIVCLWSSASLHGTIFTVLNLMWHVIMGSVHTFLWVTCVRTQVDFLLFGLLILGQPAVHPF